jgi:hypothetical protein
MVDKRDSSGPTAVSRMRRLILGATLALTFAGPSLAQNYYDSAGTLVAGVFPLPYGYLPLAPGQHNLAPSTSTALTISVGQRLAAGVCVPLSGTIVLANFRAVSPTGTLDVEYFR